jgi:hypothetical protein
MEIRGAEPADCLAPRGGQQFSQRTGEKRGRMLERHCRSLRRVEMEERDRKMPITTRTGNRKRGRRTGQKGEFVRNLGLSVLAERGI